MKITTLKNEAIFWMFNMALYYYPSRPSSAYFRIYTGSRKRSTYQKDFSILDIEKVAYFGANTVNLEKIRFKLREL